MSMSFLSLPPTKLGTESPRKKRILLVGASRAKRDMRAEAMRKLGIDVDCAVDIDEARYWWRADLYHLVLLDVANEFGVRDRFCQDIRCAKPPQQLAFLVGAPAYLSDSPVAERYVLTAEENEAEVSPTSAEAPAGPKVQQRWGILEASRRISAVRSLSSARAQAKRNRPEPPRDSEIRYSRQAEHQASPEIQAAMDLTAELRAELQKEEMQ
jgi:CheY-like chemotaxis protein